MNASSNQVAVVVLCWNGASLLRRFFPSVVQHSSGAHIVVVDNASTDDSMAYVHQHFPHVTVLRLEKNKGFAQAYNEAIALLSEEYIVLLNQDVEVSPGWLEPLVALLRSNPHLAAVQPRICQAERKSHFEYAGAAGGWIDRFGYTFCRGRLFDVLEPDQGQYHQVEEVFWASGACMALRRSVFQDLGGLDASFFAHMEEIDLCWRMKNAGHKVAFCPHAVVFHLGGGSLPQGHPLKTFLNYRNNLIMMLKNLPAGEACYRVTVRMMLDQLSAIRSMWRGYPLDAWAIVRAHVAFLVGLPRWASKRTAGNRPLMQHTGVLRKSIVWQFFIRKRKTFPELF